MPLKKKIAVYIRVSTSEQKIDGYSLEAQKNIISEYLKNGMRHELADKDIIYFSDTHSGADFNRPELNKMLELVKKEQIEIVIVYKIDRLSRSLKHLLAIFETLQKYKCSLVSLQENMDFRGSIGGLIFQIFGAIAQFERDLIQSRTKLGRIASAQQGNWVWKTAMFGYRKVKNKGGKGSKLEIVEEEAEWVRKMFDWNIYDDLGFRKIAGKLNDLKVSRGVSYTGKDRSKPWTESDVRKMLENDVYSGFRVVNKEDDKGDELPENKWTVVNVPKIITQTKFLQAEEARSERKSSQKNIYMLSGKLVDMTLDSPKKFSGCQRTKGGFSYRRKQFKDAEGNHYPVFEVPGQQIDDFVWSNILDAMQDPERFVKNYFKRGNKQEITRLNELEKELDNIEAQIIEIEEINIPRVEQGYEKGLYSDDKASEKLSKYEEKLGKLVTRRGQIEIELRSISSLSTEVEKLKDVASQVSFRIQNLSYEQRRVLCRIFVDRVEMYRKKDDNGEWVRQVKVVYNFLPKHKSDDDDEDRTTKAHQKKKKASEDAYSDVHGAEGRI